jgi:hypothetical protein
VPQKVGGKIFHWVWRSVEKGSKMLVFKLEPNTDNLQDTKAVPLPSTKNLETETISHYPFTHKSSTMNSNMLSVPFFNKRRHALEKNRHNSLVEILRQEGKCNSL